MMMAMMMVAMTRGRAMLLIAMMTKMKKDKYNDESQKLKRNRKKNKMDDNDDDGDGDDDQKSKNKKSNPTTTTHDHHRGRPGDGSGSAKNNLLSSSNSSTTNTSSRRSRLSRLPSSILSLIFSFGSLSSYLNLLTVNHHSNLVAKLPSSSPFAIQLSPSFEHLSQVPSSIIKSVRRLDARGYQFTSRKEDFALFLAYLTDSHPRIGTNVGYQSLMSLTITLPGDQSSLLTPLSALTNLQELNLSESDNSECYSSVSSSKLCASVSTLINLTSLTSCDWAKDCLIYLPSKLTILSTGDIRTRQMMKLIIYVDYHSHH